MSRSVSIEARGNVFYVSLMDEHGCRFRREFDEHESYAMLEAIKRWLEIERSCEDAYI